MPRNATGTYTLVSGNPVATGSVITSDWANTTMTDLGNALTDSLSRSGNGGMLVVLKKIDGSKVNPSDSYSNDLNTGTYLEQAGEMRVVAAGIDRMRWTNNRVDVWDDATQTWGEVFNALDSAVTSQDVIDLVNAGNEGGSGIALIAEDALDLNTIALTGFKYVTNAINAPAGFTDVLVTTLYTADSSGRAVQTCSNPAATTPIFYTRELVDGAWQGWVELWQDAGTGVTAAQAAQAVLDATASNAGTALSAEDAVDLNTIAITGFKYITNATNAPAAWGTVLVTTVYTGASSGRAVQNCSNPTLATPIFYVRELVDGIWQAWVEVWQDAGSGRTAASASTVVTDADDSYVGKQATFSGDLDTVRGFIGHVGSGVTNLPTGGLPSAMFIRTISGGGAPNYMSLTGGNFVVNDNLVWHDSGSGRTAASASTVVDDADTGNIGKTAVTAFVGDLNTLKTNGFFYAASAQTNTPIAENGTYLVNMLDTNNGTQTFVSIESDVVYCRRLEAGTWEAWYKVNGTGGGGGGSLQDAYDASSPPEILTSVLEGGVVFRRGSFAESDNVIEVRNGSNVETFSVNGFGHVVAEELEANFLKAITQLDVGLMKPLTSGDIEHRTLSSFGGFKFLASNGLTKHYLRWDSTGFGLQGNANQWLVKAFTSGGGELTGDWAVTGTLNPATDDGVGNIGIGSGVLAAIATGGDDNIAIGDSALAANTTGDRNIAIGKGAYQFGVTGASNVVIGDNACGGALAVGGLWSVFIGLNSGENATGNQLTAVGGNTLNDCTAAGITAVGFLAGNANTSGTGNVFVGRDAGANNTVGSEITCVGYEAGDKLVTGAGHTAIGAYALGAANTANYNTALGAYALNLTTGDSNTALGYEAGKVVVGASNLVAVGYQAMNAATASATAVGFRALQNVTGGSCTAVGDEAGNATTSGSNNTFVGYRAGRDMTTGGNATAIGSEAMLLAGTPATAVGYRALYQVTGLYNTAVGHAAGEDITTGANNTLMGYQAGLNVISGGSNVAIGYRAFSTATAIFETVAIGADCMLNATNKGTAIGAYALQNVTATGCVAVGQSAGQNCTSGDANTLIGESAGLSITTANNCTAVGNKALDAHVSGNWNTAVGSGALGSMTSGLGNTAIGRNADSARTGGNYSITLGQAAASSTTTASGECTLGDVNITNLRCNDTTISSLSDARDKTEIESCPIGLEYINSLNPVQFKWDYRAEHTVDGVVPSKQGTREIGFIAQELKESQDAFGADALNSYQHYPAEETAVPSSLNLDIMEADYGKLLPVMVKAIQEMSAKLDAALERISELEN